MIIDPFLNNPKTLYFKKFMSHPVNDEILEGLYEEILNDLVFKNLSLGITCIPMANLEEIAAKEAQKRFEDLSQ